jgi:hypothetical protein
MKEGIQRSGVVYDIGTCLALDVRNVRGCDGQRGAGGASARKCLVA